MSGANSTVGSLMPVNNKSDPAGARAGTNYPGTPPASNSNYTILIVACSVLFVSLVGVFVALVVFTRRKRNVMGKAYRPLRKTLSDRSDTLALDDLKRETAEVIGSTDAAKRVLSRVIDEHAERRAIKAGKVKLLRWSPTSCPIRYPDIKIRRSTQLIVKKPDYQEEESSPRMPALHMTMLYDYYGDTLLLCQAPVRKQFVAQWSAIWQEEVGLVVWVGDFEEKRMRKIDPYIPLRETQRMQIGPFTVLTAAIFRRPHEYDQYMVRVFKMKAKGRRLRSREVIFVHIHCWPDHSAPTVPINLVNLVERLQHHHERMKAKRLPGVMMHCSAGLQRSPALMALYIGRKIWKENGRVNVVGILRYIRRRRYKAFGFVGAEVQVQVIFGLMRIIATRLEFLQKSAAYLTKRSALDDSDPFDAHLRRSSWGQRSGSGSTTRTSSSRTRTSSSKTY